MSNMTRWYKVTFEAIVGSIAVRLRWWGVSLGVARSPLAEAVELRCGSAAEPMSQGPS